MRFVSNRSVGAAAVLSGLVSALTLAWPGFGAHGAFTGVFGTMLLVRSIVAFLLSLVVAFGLWRLAVGRPGERALKSSFVLVCSSVAVLVALIAIGYLSSSMVVSSASRSLPSLALRSLPLLVLWVPTTIGFVASVPLVFGLLRSELVPAWIAWLAAAKTLLAAVASIVGAPAQYALFTQSPPHVVPGLLGWVRPVASWVGVLVLLALGIALVLRRDNGVVEQAHPADGVGSEQQGSGAVHR